VVFSEMEEFIPYYTQIPGEHTGEGMHLVAAGEQSEFPGAGLAQAVFHDLEGLIPGDHYKIRAVPVG